MVTAKERPTSPTCKRCGASEVMTIETRPERLLATARPDLAVLALGVCPLCHLALTECEAYQSMWPSERANVAVALRNDAQVAVFLSDLQYGVSMGGAR